MRKVETKYYWIITLIFFFSVALTSEDTLGLTISTLMFFLFFVLSIIRTFYLIMDSISASKMRKIQKIEDEKQQNAKQAEEERMKQELLALEKEKRDLKMKNSVSVAGTNYRQDDIRNFVVTYAKKVGLPKYEGMSPYEIKEYHTTIYEYPIIDDAIVTFEEEPENEYDSNAIKVLLSFSNSKKYHIGYIPKSEQDKVNDWLSNGMKYYAEITGGKYKEPDLIYSSDYNSDLKTVVHNRQSKYSVRLYFED